MSSHVPLVSIGMPVFNGEHYLAEALDSLLSQTFMNFEIIVSDNASTDATHELFGTYQKKDQRIRYYRNSVNLGAWHNLNRVFELSQGTYFLWAHHDDRRDLNYLEKCVKILERDPSCVLCYSRTRDIDEKGHLTSRVERLLNMQSERGHDRFKEIIRMDHLCEPIFGLIRASLLKKTPVIGNYPDSDRVLLAELALYGHFHQIPEVLFFRRAHALQSTAQHPSRQSRAAWYDPRKTGKITFPHFRQLREYLKAISRVRLPLEERLSCYLSMMNWLLVNRKRLSADLTDGTKDFLRPLVKARAN